MERPSTTEELRTELLERTGAGRFSRDVEPDTDDRVLGRYRLERRIGAGGYGVVWKGWDERLERDVAVKVIAIEGEGRATQRAEREGHRTRLAPGPAMPHPVSSRRHVRRSSCR